MNFYSTFADAQQHSRSPIQLIAVLPEATQSGQEFLHAHQVRVDEVANASLSNLHVEATPTLLLVDVHGKAIKEWIGKLTPDGEQQVTTAILE